MFCRPVCPSNKLVNCSRLQPYYTMKQYIFDISQTAVHMAVNMEPSVQYFHINTIQ
jgi:hypothetical protein